MKLFLENREARKKSENHVLMTCLVSFYLNQKRAGKCPKLYNGRCLSVKSREKISELRFFYCKFITTRLAHSPRDRTLLPTTDKFSIFSFFWCNSPCIFNVPRLICHSRANGFSAVCFAYCSASRFPSIAFELVDLHVKLNLLKKPYENEKKFTSYELSRINSHVFNDFSFFLFHFQTLQQLSFMKM